MNRLRLLRQFLIIIVLVFAIFSIDLAPSLKLKNKVYAETTQANPATVLVVANKNNQESIKLADYYMSKRAVPALNYLELDWVATDSADTISEADYNTKIAQPVYDKIKTLSRIDYIVLCRNLPSKISGFGSVDSALAGHLEKGSRLNPYLNKSAPFSSVEYGIYLVTRLDGWSWEDARALVDHSITAKPGGTIFLDLDPSKTGGYARFNTGMENTNSISVPGVNIVFDVTTAFVNPGYAMAGYASWGSNDSKFNSTAWKSLAFVPGAIAETAVSTSASNLRSPGGSQSQIAQLIQNGVTGVKGYVTEPMLSAIANPSTMFQRYTSGRNLAESFYAASQFITWKDVVIGDPLCSPYSGGENTQKVAISVDAEPITGVSGTIVTYTINYDNPTDKNITNVVITDQVPTGTTYVANSASNGAVFNNNALTWNINTVPAGSFNTVTFQVTIN